MPRTTALLLAFALLAPAIPATAGQSAPTQAAAQAPGSPAAAANVVKSYYKALAAGDFGTAWRLWGNGGLASGKSLADFSAGFAQTKTTSVRITSVGQPDPGAGSVYIPIGVEVDATLKNGKSQKFTGTYQLRRVNDVDGSTADQRLWHIQSASLAPAK